MRDNWSTDYKFNGKPACRPPACVMAGREKDEETGMYYYGARYYIPELSILGSVNPLSDKSSNESPFMYCRGNPMMSIYPYGMDDGWYVDETATIIGKKK